MACREDDLLPQEDLRTTLLPAVNQLRTAGCRCGDTLMPPVAPLVWNDVLASSAGQHVQDMIQQGYFSHLSPDGTPPIQRAVQAGYAALYVGENIARGYRNSAAVVEGWLASESHCRNMMDSTYSEMGAAAQSTYWVLDLGRPE